MRFFNRFRRHIRISLSVSVALGAVGAITAGGALFSACSGPPNGSDPSLGSPNVEAVAAQGWELIKMNSYNYADTELDSFGHFTTTPNACHQDAEGALDLPTWNNIAHLMNQALSRPLLSQDNEACFPTPSGSKLYGTVDVIVDPPAPRGGNPSIVYQPAPFPSIPWPFPSWIPNPFASSTPTPTVTVSSTPTSTPTSTPSSTPTHTPTHSPTPSASPSPSPSGITETLFENRGDQICTTIQDTNVAQQLVQAFDQVAATANKEDCPSAH